MVNEINLVSLGNTNIQFIDGDRGKNYPQKTDFYKNGYCVFLNTGNVKPDGFDFSDLYYITQEKDEILNKGRVQLNDIVLTTRGTVGNVAIFDDQVPFKKIRINSGMVIIRCSNRFYPYFLYSFFRSSLFKSQCGLNGSGSAQPQLPISAIKNIKIPEFNLKTQQSIAAVLSALDKKIALNKQINARLEEMAKTLYDYWFVQFDFPDANGKPYKSSGGEMVFDETLKRKIPKGWEVKNLGDWAEIRKGTLITEKTANTNGDIKVISAGVDFSYYHDVANRPRNTITISASGANAGFVNFWREPIFACDCTTITNRVIGSTLYILNFLKIVQDFIYQQARGSAQPHVYPKDIEGLKIIVPPDLLLKRFSKFVENWNLKIANNEKQNHQLTQLHDFLLPMLMNGQVSVAE